ncbi:unnamed protein product [Nesidiocoris tenuis]|uniref:Laminin EGF-like domain-containing protein n=1 Tax=Nesidiocoris tenuis TaxID=355587 RepID=A0A6H5HL15_9HEMI|nr:unnamed protein product [Nesidiocoris tenuis]
MKPKTDLHSGASLQATFVSWKILENPKSLIGTCFIRACNCNGFSTRCIFDEELWEKTGHGGHCIDCAENRDGPNCERCRDNYFLTEDGQCLPCYCNDIDPKQQCMVNFSGFIESMFGRNSEKWTATERGLRSAKEVRYNAKSQDISVVSSGRDPAYFSAPVSKWEQPFEEGQENQPTGSKGAAALRDTSASSASPVPPDTDMTRLEEVLSPCAFLATAITTLTAVTLILVLGAINAVMASSDKSTQSLERGRVQPANATATWTLTLSTTATGRQANASNAFTTQLDSIATSAWQGCQPCNCNVTGSKGPGCDENGQCVCRTGVTGLQCDECERNQFGFSATGCQPCECDPFGSSDLQCNSTGHCPALRLKGESNKIEENHLKDAAEVEVALWKSQSKLDDAEKLQQQLDALMAQADSARSRAIEAVKLGEKTFTDAQETLELLQHEDRLNLLEKRLQEIQRTFEDANFEEQVNILNNARILQVTIADFVEFRDDSSHVRWTVYQT